MEKKNRRLALAKSSLEANTVESFADLMTLVTINLMREALDNENHKSMTAKVFHPEKFTIEDLVALARTIGCDPSLLLQLALKEYLRNKTEHSGD